MVFVGDNQIYVGFWWGDLKSRDLLENLGNIKLDHKDIGWEAGTGFIHLSTGKIDVPSGHGNETSSSIRCSNFLTT